MIMAWFGTLGDYSFREGIVCRYDKLQACELHMEAKRTENLVNLKKSKLGTFLNKLEARKYPIDFSGMND